MLEKFNGTKNILIKVDDELKSDLNIIAKVADSARDGLSIARELCKPPLSTLTFHTKAAGGSFFYGTRRKNILRCKEERNHLPGRGIPGKYLDLEQIFMARKIDNRPERGIWES